MPMKLGVYGHGPQSKRYLDPKNWPDGVEVVQLERDRLDYSLDGIIVANAPAFHHDAALDALQSGKPVLCEKPIALTYWEPEVLLKARGERPFLVAHTHLWHQDFQFLEPSPSAVVQWRGPRREDGSCPPMLDWGPHAWSMAIALGTDRVSTGKGDRRENCVWSKGKYYPRGDWHGSPMKEMLATFASLIDGGYDWRAEPDFALEVHRRCFGQREPVRSMGLQLTGVTGPG